VINKTKLLRQIEEKFKIKAKAEEILYYTEFEWRDDSALEKVEIYIGSRVEKVNNDIRLEYQDYILIKDSKDIYLLLKNNERR
jgi:hypothetical protein